jgi:hypothetical protein
MGYIKEPNGIDFLVSPMPLLDEDRQTISAFISAYKITGKEPVTVLKETKKMKIKHNKSFKIKEVLVSVE